LDRLDAKDHEHCLLRQLAFVRPGSSIWPHSIGDVRGRRADDAQAQALEWVVKDLRTVGLPLESVLT